MRAEEIMTRDPKTLTSSQTVADAVQIMKSEHCGVVPIVNEGEKTIIGVVTDRDIALGSCDSGGKGPDTPISSIMSTSLFCVDRSEDLSAVQKMMESAGVRRIPVVEEDNKLVGIISMKDLADNLGVGSLGGTDSVVLQQKPNS
jgi:CBS domain-containing protein